MISMVERRWIEYVVLVLILLILILPQFVSVIVMVRPDPPSGCHCLLGGAQKGGTPGRRLFTFSQPAKL